MLIQVFYKVRGYILNFDKDLRKLVKPHIIANNYFSIIFDCFTLTKKPYKILGLERFFIEDPDKILTEIF